MSDLTPEHVRAQLKQVGYEIPELDLLEVTARLNALVEGMAGVEHYTSNAIEPWPTLLHSVRGER